MDRDEKEIENVVQICQAYENGFNAGRMNLSADNNAHMRESDEFYAWHFGHNIGIQLELMEYEEGWIN